MGDSGIGASSSSSPSSLGYSPTDSLSTASRGNAAPSTQPVTGTPNFTGLSAIESGTADQATPGDSNGIRVRTVPLAGGSSPGEGNLTHLATLNVGDRFASAQQNSPETARAAGPNLPGSASYSVSVPGTQSSSGQAAMPSLEGVTRHATTVQSSEPEPTQQAPQAFILKKKHFIIADSGHAMGPGSGGGYTASSISTSPPPSLGVPSASHGSESSGGSAQSTSRYVLDTHDVHDMGGTKSSIQISNGSGEVLRTVELPPGDSRTIVDLPPGDYTFTAVSGQRGPHPQMDNLDNFRLDISQAGSNGTGSSVSGASTSP